MYDNTLMCLCQPFFEKFSNEGVKTAFFRDEKGLLVRFDLS